MDSVEILLLALLAECSPEHYVLVDGNSTMEDTNIRTC